MSRKFVFLVLFAGLITSLAFWSFPSWTSAQCAEDPNDPNQCDTLSFHRDPMAATDTNEIDASLGFAAIPIYYTIDDSLAGMEMAFRVTRGCPITIDSVSFVNSSPGIKAMPLKLVQIWSPDSLTIAISGIVGECIPANMPNVEIMAEIFISFNPAAGCCYIQIDSMTTSGGARLQFVECVNLTSFKPRFYPKVYHLSPDPGYRDTLSFHRDPMAASDTNEIDATPGFAAIPIYYTIDENLAGMQMVFRVARGCPITIDSISFVNSSSGIKAMPFKTVQIWSPDSLAIAISGIACIPANMPNVQVVAEIFISFDPADTCCHIQIDSMTTSGGAGLQFVECVNLTSFKPRFYPKVYHLSGPGYICGNANGIGDVDFTDILYLIDYTFRGTAPPVCTPICLCANVNGVGDVDFTDILYLIDYIFKGAAPPVGYPGSCPCP